MNARFLVLAGALMNICSQHTFADARVIVQFPKTMTSVKWSLTEIPTIQSLMKRLDRPRDAVVHMYRPSYQQIQSEEISMCREAVRRLPQVRYRVRDGVADVEATKNALTELSEQLLPTGRVIDFAPIDPLQFHSNPELDRKLRDGDRFLVIEQHSFVWTWDATHGFRQRAHAPLRSATDYGIDAISSGAARGDWVYWIGPHGELSRLGVASYNRAARPIPPGSILFYPPPGFGRSNQPAFQCIASALRYQNLADFETQGWWFR